MTAEFDGCLAKPQGVHWRSDDACDRQLSRNVVPTCAEYLAHHRRPAVPGARDVEIFKLASFALHGSGPHVSLRHQWHDRARRRGADRARLVHTSGRVHPGRRHGRRILHSARVEGVLSAPERGGVGYHLLLRVPLSRSGGRRRVEPRSSEGRQQGNTGRGGKNVVNRTSSLTAYWFTASTSFAVLV